MTTSEYLYTAILKYFKLTYIKIIRGVELNTDHQLLVADTNNLLPCIKIPKTYDRLTMEVLLEKVKKQIYIDLF